MVTTDTIHMLEDKIQFIHQDGKDIYLVGPIKLPINLYGRLKFFNGILGYNVVRLQIV